MPSRRPRGPLLSGSRTVRLLFCAVAAASVLLVGQARAEGQSLDRRPPPVAALLASINRDRALHDEAPLALDPRLSECARAHSAQMAADGILTHDSSSRVVCVAHSVFGENAARAQGRPRRALPFLNRLMMAEGPCLTDPCSPGEFETHGHFMNLLNPRFTEIGVGVYYAAGTTWLTEVLVG